MLDVPARTFSLEVEQGVFVDVSIQLKASGVSVPKPRPNPRRLADLSLDIGDPSSGEPSTVATFTIDLRYQG